MEGGGTESRRAGGAEIWRDGWMWTGDGKREGSGGGRRRERNINKI
jgi:hypothetical protein